MENKWIAGVATTVVSGVLVYWLTVGIKPASMRETNHIKPSIGFTENWAGSWICKCDTHEMYLTITGKGGSSSLNANYPKAYGNKPATEEYIIKNISESSVSGEYIYKDASPLTGYQSQPGLWKGNWIITQDSSAIHLTRKDYTTSWQGEYQCLRR